MDLHSTGWRRGGGVVLSKLPQDPSLAQLLAFVFLADSSDSLRFSSRASRNGLHGGFSLLYDGHRKALVFGNREACFVMTFYLCASQLSLALAQAVAQPASKEMARPVGKCWISIALPPCCRLVSFNSCCFPYWCFGCLVSSCHVFVSLSGICSSSRAGSSTRSSIGPSSF